MKAKNTLPISEVRRKIFSIAEEVQNPDVYYTLTERGRPKAVILSAESFESVWEKNERYFPSAVLRGEESYEKRRMGTSAEVLILRDEFPGKHSFESEEFIKHKESEYIKSVLYVELIEKHGYPLRSMELNRCVRIDGEKGRRYMELDVTVTDKNGRTKMIFEVASLSDYEKNSEKVFRDLFSVADIIKWEGNLKYLVCYSHSNKKSRVERKISAVDYAKYNSFSSWKKAGKPVSRKIPEYGG